MSSRWKIYTLLFFFTFLSFSPQGRAHPHENPCDALAELRAHSLSHFQEFEEIIRAGEMSPEMMRGKANDIYEHVREYETMVLEHTVDEKEAFHPLLGGQNPALVEKFRIAQRRFLNVENRYRIHTLCARI